MNQDKDVRQDTDVRQDKDVRIEPAELEAAMRSEFKELVKETADAMNKARDGEVSSEGV